MKTQQEKLNMIERLVREGMKREKAVRLVMECYK